jgi:hypothetical protein
VVTATTQALPSAPARTSVTSTTTPAPSLRVLPPARLNLQASQQPYFGVGAVRWAFLVVVGVGLAATLGTVLVELRRRRRKVARP